MDYNTSRKKLALPEYGRHVLKMVEHLKTIEDREKRNQQAKAIIAIMGSMNPHLRDVLDFKHKLWDHLIIMSDFDIDIDSPYVIPTPETLNEKPNRIPYPQSKIVYKHYGKTLELLIKRAAEYEEGEEKKALMSLIANHMKKSYLTWNREAVDDAVIFQDIKELSRGQLQIMEDLKLPETRDILYKNRPKSNLQRRNKNQKRDNNFRSHNNQNYSNQPKGN